ncbi:hypothetical protein BQ8794_140112 [Mesorhizobium prunaredense]|uniref:Uncharacterized protein n=1 Tax=Mesorhizobium prunaredense TaxID=1631249 RepID=A0A1R3V251_9HYPH|nr:hypothetical protein BQ8794_140112 [Mesorhizobium prunaredense]
MGAAPGLGLHCAFPGNAAAHAALPDVLRPADAGLAHRTVDRRSAWPHLLRQCLSRRDLARRRRCAAARPVGRRRQSRPPLPAGTEADHPAASVFDHPRPDRRFPGAADQVDRADLDHRFRGTGQDIQRHQQCDLRAVHRLWAGRLDLLCHVLPADAICTQARTRDGYKLGICLCGQRSNVSFGSELPFTSPTSGSDPKRPFLDRISFPEADVHQNHQS